MERTEGVQLCSWFTLTLDGVFYLTSRSSSFIPGNEQRYPVYRSCVRPRGQGCTSVQNIKSCIPTWVVRDSSVAIATSYGLDGPGIESWWGARYSTPVHTGHGAHPASYTMGTGYLPGAKRLGRGADHPPFLAPRLKKE
jgi:hypothetical protein